MDSCNITNEAMSSEEMRGLGLVFTTCAAIPARPYHDITLNPYTIKWVKHIEAQKEQQNERRTGRFVLVRYGRRGTTSTTAPECL